MDSVMILGAGIYQVPLIDRVRERGYRAIVLSMPGKYPGIELADAFFPVNTTDVEKVVEIANNCQPKAVMTTGTDVALFSLAKACENLGLPGPSTATAKLATNKALMKEAFCSNDVRTAKYKKVNNIAEAVEAFKSMRSPVMIKCVDKSGSRGISKVGTCEQVVDAFSFATSVSDCEYAVVEEYIDANEVGVDGYVSADGEVEFAIPHDKVVWNNGLTDIPIGHRINERFLSEIAEHTDLYDQVSKTVTALGMKSSFFNMDVFIDRDNKTWIIEAGARVGATCIPEVIGLYYGENYYDAIIDASLGTAPSLNLRNGSGAVEGRLLFTRTKSRYTAAMSECQEDCVVQMDYHVGSIVPAFKAGNDRCGQIVAKGSTEESVARKIDSLAIRITSQCFTACC